MSAEQRARGTLVEALSSALDQGSHGLANAPALLRRILEEESWREFETQRREIVCHAEFLDFVETPPLKGLGASREIVERIVADDDVATRLLRSVIKGTYNRSTRLRTTGHGTRRDYALERLNADAPELHAQVVAGRISAHAAMVQAGFRKKTLSVPISDTAATARALRRNLDEAALADLIAELSKEDGEP